MPRLRVPGLVSFESVRDVLSMPDHKLSRHVSFEYRWEIEFKRKLSKLRKEIDFELSKHGGGAAHTQVQVCLAELVGVEPSKHGGRGGSQASCRSGWKSLKVSRQVY